jgi:hypothetical protein
MKFCICDFYEYLSRDAKFGSNSTGMSGTLREGLSVFHIVDSDTCSSTIREKTFFVSVTTPSISVTLLTATYRLTSATEGKNFCVKVATMFTRTGHDIAL